MGTCGLSSRPFFGTLKIKNNFPSLRFRPCVPFNLSFTGHAATFSWLPVDVFGNFTFSLLCPQDAELEDDNIMGRSTGDPVGTRPKSKIMIIKATKYTNIYIYTYIYEYINLQVYKKIK